MRQPEVPDSGKFVCNPEVVQKRACGKLVGASVDLRTTCDGSLGTPNGKGGPAGTAAPLERLGEAGFQELSQLSLSP